MPDLPSGIAIVRALPEHAVSLAPRLRPEDVREARLACGHTPLEALQTSLRASAGGRGKAFTVLADGIPEILFGAAEASPLSDAGRPWMLSSGFAGKVPVVFARRCAGCLAELGRGFRILENRVHADNRLSTRWLARLGFCFDPPAPFGVNGALFRRFWKETGERSAGAGTF